MWSAGPALPASPTIDQAIRQIIADVDSYMFQSNVRNSGWYVGITSNVNNRLFGHHKVDRNRDLWIYRTCPNEAAARAIESAYHRAGCKGGTGGGSGDGTCVVLYAYRITLSTVE